eukprot:TRINITY_DN24532_c0_g1_i1.p2 TRINITY_DN24532_c0_g1~~TRINITY_DN24532_c0_g1_i1.p2  ORF type:complete len:185 (-),score=22.21 TRINITY_DN24532_c0_g1_i1:255-809(-)
MNEFEASSGMMAAVGRHRPTPHWFATTLAPTLGGPAHHKSVTEMNQLNGVSSHSGSSRFSDFLGFDSSATTLPDTRQALISARRYVESRDHGRAPRIGSSFGSSAQKRSRSSCGSSAASGSRTSGSERCFTEASFRSFSFAASSDLFESRTATPTSTSRTGGSQSARLRDELPCDLEQRLSQHT